MSLQSCNFQRENPQKRRDKVYIGCGAGFGGDRPLAALKLLHRVQQLNYLVLECLAERTLADRYQLVASGGGLGYDSRSMFRIGFLVFFVLRHCIRRLLFYQWFGWSSNGLVFQFRIGCVCFYLWLWREGLA